MLKKPFLKPNNNYDAFLRSIRRIISKGSNNKGALLIGLDFKNGKIVIYKDTIIGEPDLLGYLISPDYIYDFKAMIESYGIVPADETNLPDVFLTKEDFSFYIITIKNQERIKL